MSEKAPGGNSTKSLSELQAENSRIRHNLDAMRSILDAQTDLFILIDKQGVVREANEVVSRYLGIGHEDFIGTCIWDFFPEDSSQSRKEQADTVFSSGEPLRFEDKYDQVWYDVMLYPVSKEGRKPDEIAILARDITPHKQIEDLLRFQRDLGIVLSSSLELHELLSRILDAVMGVEGVDSGGVYMLQERTGDMNLVVQKGMPANVAHSLNHMEASSPQVRFVREGRPLYWNNQEASKRFRVTLPQDEVQGVAIIPIKSEGSVIAFLSLISRDFDKIPVTSRIALETVAGRIGDVINRTKSAELLRKYELIVDTIHNPMSFIDRNYVFQAVNNAYLSAFSRTRSDFIGRSVEDIVSPEVFAGSMKKHLDRALEGKEVHCEEWFDYPGWGSRYCLLSYYPFFAPDGTVTGVAAVSRDITDRRIKEEEHLRMSKLESVSMLAGGIAHDFNNLLATILGNIELAQFHIAQDHPANLRLIKAIESCNRSRDLIRQFMTLSKGGISNKKDAPLLPLISDSVNLALSGTHITCAYDIQEELWSVEFDANQILHALHSIVMNAREAMHEEGRITITARNIAIGKDSAEHPKFVKQGSYVVIDVQDQGTGIPEEIKDKIFDPYFSTKGKGTRKGMGLGLATAYSIIKKHGGYIVVESTVGSGSVFRIYLPAASGEAVGEDTAALPHGDASRDKILTMDDEEMIRDAAAEILEHLGYRVESSKNGEEAIEKFIEAKHSGRSFGVVILDLTVDNGMGGAETMKKLKEIDPGVVGIVSSGYAEDNILENYREFGFSAAIAKPYTAEELKDTLKKIY